MFCQKNQVVYQRYFDNTPVHDKIYLKKDGTFLTQLSGGCDGRLESKGKWKINKDTLHFTDIESRIMDDPWKRSEGGCKFLMKNATLTSFSWVDDKMVLNNNGFYKRIKGK